jgi:hypothetical protein
MSSQTTSALVVPSSAIAREPESGDGFVTYKFVAQFGAHRIPISQMIVPAGAANASLEATLWPVVHALVAALNATTSTREPARSVLHLVP